MNTPISAIEQMIPHRAPFLFIDEILERTSNSIICQKKISENDLYLVYSDGDEKYVSDVALVECVLQSGACLLSDNSSNNTDSSQKQKYFIGSPNVKIGVIPEIGDILMIYVEIIQRFGQNNRLKGKIIRGQDLVLDGMFLVGEK